jgi:hypothetical protein
LLKVYDDPMPQSSYPNYDSHPHPRHQQQRQKRGVQVFLNGPTDSDGLEYYCRAVIEVDTRMRSKSDRSRLSMPSLDAKQCVSILMILYATRITEIQSQTLRLFDLTYQEQVWQTSGSEDCIEALRQWAFEMVEVLDKIFAICRPILALNCLPIQHNCDIWNFKWLHSIIAVFPNVKTNCLK